MMNCEGKKHCGTMKLACLLVIIGALNWGLIGLGGFMGSDWNVVHMILGGWPQVEWVVYILVGLSALGKLLGCKCSTCSDASKGM